MRQLDHEYKESHLNYKKRLIKLKPNDGNLSYERKGSAGFLPPINQPEDRFRNRDIKLAKGTHENSRKGERQSQHAVHKSMDFSLQEPILTKAEEQRIKNFDNSDFIIKQDSKPSIGNSSKTIVEPVKANSDIPSTKTIPKTTTHIQPKNSPRTVTPPPIPTPSPPVSKPAPAVKTPPESIPEPSPKSPKVPSPSCLQIPYRPQ